MSRVVAPLRLRRALAALAVAVSLASVAACGDSPTQSNPLAGSYTATVFRVLPEGSTQMLDVRAAGGTLTIVIAEDNTTTGELFLPGALIGGTDFRAPMTGRATVNAGVLSFTQGADTFIRDLRWSVGSGTVSVSDQLLAGDRYTITLSR